MELATRIFTPADQARFAALSGDRNPIHLDALAARRTQMGAPIVHGAHTVLWALEEACCARPFSAAGLQMNFAAPLYVGEAALARIVSHSNTEFKIDVVTNGAVASAITVELGRPRPAGRPHAYGETRPAEWPDSPIEHNLQTIGLQQPGAFAFARPADAIAAEFPALCRAISTKRVSAMLALSRLVGMILPGLHSILKGFALDFTEESSAEIIHYSPLGFEKRFRLLRTRISGPGVEGEVSSFLRTPPVQQPGMAEIAARVPRNAYAGAQVLVVGGSRGLGEVAAKACSAGGADVVLTYATGRDDAERVAAEIAGHGMRCEIRALDVTGDIAAQCAGLSPTHLYYCASPAAARRHPQLFSASVLSELMAVYTKGFYETCRTLAQNPGQTLRTFYPLPELAEPSPRGWTEYSMAKVAGEALCQTIDRHLAGVQVLSRRLPQVLTDQTATVSPARYASVLDVMLPCVAEMQTAVQLRDLG